MIKKFFLIWIGVILLALPSCAAGPSADKAESHSQTSAGSQVSVSSQAPMSGGASSAGPALSSSRAPASSADSSSTLSKTASNIVFREGTAKDGKVILSSSDLTGFYTEDDTFNHSYKMIGFKLKKSAEESFSEETERLAKSEGTLSLWAGEERLNSSTLSDPIIGDTFVLSHLEEDQLDGICKKLKSAD
ncbi:hypothetical protein EQM14_14415 [Caproiciproducens sp. NJN-50]|uniref:hypothetical protein n=1 Tax=Acutalibacteraceae TaxID=3082771 RepID=UPI000FFE2D0E|nr:MULTISPECIES: hypothetical protein [Acutalibacteraceae]QAT50865.1 hypothetical protein EQM14_14415 [Caproiciproducens sp. NJN-50]